MEGGKDVPRRITDADIVRVCDLLDSWPPASKLTWKLLVQAAVVPLGFKTTRQTLESKARIKNAYLLAKGISRVTGRSLVDRLSVTSYLRERVEILEAKCHRLEQENQNLLNQFRTWVYNAEAQGITVDILNRQLPPIDREKTTWRPG